MPIRQTKRVERLYDEVSGYDLVVVPDAPLGRALNNRLDRPHLGRFATTPRLLAARRRETTEDRLAFISVVNETDLGWKQAAYAVGNVLQCWEHQGEPDAILEYEAFGTDATRTVVEKLSGMDTTSRRLTDYEIDTDEHGSVAVVGESQLTNLESSILPESYDSVDRFSDETFNLPPLRVFDSATAIVDAVLDTVTGENADDVAVVLDESSEYSALVESALEASGVPFYGGPGFADDQDHRAFLRLLRFAVGGNETTVGDISPLLTRLGADVDAEHHEKKLDGFEEVDADETANWLRDLRRRRGGFTLAEALDGYEKHAGRSLDTFRKELRRIGLSAEPVTEETVERLAFYLRRYEVPVDRENEGVLLADAKSASFVDRPLVLHLGLDEGWTHTSPKRPWVDRDEEYERKAEAFQSILQSGAKGYYLVRDSAGGSPVTPCLYLEELLEDDFERFTDLNHVRHSRTLRKTGDGFEKETDVVEAPLGTRTTVSQSSLNSYTNCPRDYFFSRLVEGPDKDYFVEGNLFHDFAEFCVNHPDFVDDAVIDEAVQVMVDEVRQFYREYELATKRTEYRVGLRTIAEYLEKNSPDDGDFLTPTSGWGDNFFAEYFGLSVDSPVTERWFEDEELGVKGKIDLVVSPIHLLDFKSGSRKPASKVTKNSAVNPPSDEPDFQALLYLTYYRSLRPGEELRFTFFHFLETVDDEVMGSADVDDCLTDVRYLPIEYDEFVASEEVYDELCEEAANDCNKTFSKGSYETYREVVDAHEVPRTRDADEMAGSDFGEALTERMVSEVGDYKYVRNGCVQAFRHLCGYRKEAYFVEDVDEFERFVDEVLEEMSRHRSGDERYPVEGRAGEPNYRRVDNRDLILNDGWGTETTTEEEE